MSGRYDREFKLEAIRLSEEEGSSAAEVERRLGIGQGGISHWKRQLGSKGDSAFPGKGQQRGLEETVRQLQRECERLRRERDILKNIVGPFGATCGGRNSGSGVVFPVNHGRSDRLLIGGVYPVKKRGPGILADLRVVTLLSDPV